MRELAAAERKREGIDKLFRAAHLKASIEVPGKGYPLKQAIELFDLDDKEFGPLNAFGVAINALGKMDACFVANCFYSIPNINTLMSDIKKFGDLGSEITRTVDANTNKLITERYTVRMVEPYVDTLKIGYKIRTLDRSMTYASEPTKEELFNTLHVPAKPLEALDVFLSFSSNIGPLAIFEAMVSVVGVTEAHKRMGDVFGDCKHAYTTDVQCELGPHYMSETDARLRQRELTGEVIVNTLYNRELGQNWMGWVKVECRHRGERETFGWMVEKNKRAGYPHPVEHAFLIMELVFGTERAIKIAGYAPNKEVLEKIKRNPVHEETPVKDGFADNVGGGSGYDPTGTYSNGGCGGGGGGGN